MNSTNVPNSPQDSLRAQLPHLSLEQRKAATYALENPDRVSLASTREAAAAAGVTPNTFVRLSRVLGYDGFKAFKTHLARASFQPSRQALALQARTAAGTLDTLKHEVLSAAAATLRHLEVSATTTALQAAAQTIVAARKVYVLGVGMANPVALNFAYLGAMALDNIVALPRDGSQPVDGLVRAGAGDTLIAMTFKPYRREVVEAAAAAHEQGLDLIAVSDSPAAPHFAAAQHRFDVPVSGPQFFTSTVALTAFLETLMAFVIAAAPARAIEDIDRFHERRHRLGIYLEDQSPWV